MKTNLLRLVLPLAALGFVAAGTASAQTAIPGGTHSATYVITKPGSYYLAGNRTMSNLGSNAIEINAPDVTLDLRGYTLSFSQASGGSGAGIDIGDGINVEVRNGSIQDTPGRAIYVENSVSNGVRFIDLRIAGSQGVYVNAANAVFERCYLSDITAFNAIQISQVGAVIRDCNISNVLNGAGIYVTGGSLIVGNVVNDVAFHGISVSVSEAGVSGALVADNVVTNANQKGHEWFAGIDVFCPGATIRGNTVSKAKSTGIRATGYGVLIERNFVSYTAKGNAAGVGIQAFTNNMVVRDNSGASNAGGLMAGAAINGGGNVGN